MAFNPLARFGLNAAEATRPAPDALEDAPPLPVLDFAQAGGAAPVPLETPADALPQADAEWAALHHVFCAPGEPMPYADRTRGSWPGWQRYDRDLKPGGAKGWTFWGETRLVSVAGRRVLLFKSNTHLDFPGASFLEAMIRLIVAQVKPTLILSIGTAGGAMPGDHIGTVRAVSAGTLYEADEPQADWPTYRNGWAATLPDIEALLFAIPTTQADLEALAATFNKQHGSDYALEELNPGALNLGDATPNVVNQTGSGGTPLLTTGTFVVGSTDGTYEAYAAIEMDDAVIAETLQGTGVAFGFIRNISDPVQNAALPAKIQGAWGSLIYETYGLYTSYNGAVAAWTAVNAAS